MIPKIDDSQLRKTFKNSTEKQGEVYVEEEISPKNDDRSFSVCSIDCDIALSSAGLQKPQLSKKCILIYIDILGFEKKAKNDAKKTKRPIEDIRDSFRNSIKIRLNELKNKNIIFHFQEMSFDSWLLFSDEFINVFKTTGKILKAKLPLEIVIGVKVFSKSTEKELIALSNETMNYLKNDIIKQYKNWYKKRYKNSPVNTFILFTTEAYEELYFKHICYKPFSSAEFYLAKFKKFEKYLNDLEFIEEKASHDNRIIDTEIDLNNYLTYAKEPLNPQRLRQRILKAIEYIYEVKSPDGGWGPTPYSNFRLLNTCEIILGILSTPNLRQKDKNQIYITLNKIFENRCDDGGFPSKTYDTFTLRCSSTTECTSWVAYICLANQQIFDEMKVQIHDKIHDAIEWLKSNFDCGKGGWGLWLGEYVRLYPTLWAMRALNLCKTISDIEFKEYFDRVVNLHSSNNKYLFGFYPNKTANIPISSLFLILLDDISKTRNDFYNTYKEELEKYEGKIIDYIFSEETKFLWDEKEEIKHHNTVQAKDGGYIKFQFTHFSSAYSIMALYHHFDKLNKYQKFRLKLSLKMLLSLQEDDGRFRMVNTAIPTDYNFITALSLYTLKNAFEFQD